MKTLKKRYAKTNDGNMDDGVEKTRVWGMNWFFCHPKKKKEDSKCTKVL